MHNAQSRHPQLQKIGIDNSRQNRTPGALGAVAMALIAVGLVTSNAALAQSYPSKAITAIVPYPAGSTGADLLMREMAADAQKTLGQTILVENRAGAGGKLGIIALQKAKGDPYVICQVTSTMLVNLTFTDPDLTTLQPGRDYTSVSVSVLSVSAFSAHPSMPFRDVKGFIAYAKANPGKLNFGVSSIAGPGQIGMLRLMEITGIDVNIIPYKGEAPVVLDILSGQVQISFLSGVVKPHVDAGKIVTLATTGPTRWPQFPTVPTMIEAGIPGFTAGYWVGLASPADIPGDALNKLNSAFNASLKSPAVTKRIADVGFVLAGSSPQEMTQKIRAEMEELGPILRKFAAKVN